MSNTTHNGCASWEALDEAAATWRYQPATDALQGQTILVTGASAGIGACLAKTSAIFGANVVLLGRRREKLDTVFDWIEAHTDTLPVIVPADLEHLTGEAAEQLAHSIRETYGRLDGLIHNASLLGAKTPLAHYPAQEWQRVFQVNIHAPFILTQALFALLDEADRASIINISSSVGREGRAYWGAYSASKFALEGFSQILADETEQAGRIQVFSLNPGATRTAMRAAAYPTEDPQTVAPPEAHMDLLLYLLSARGQPGYPATGTLLDARDWTP